MRTVVTGAAGFVGGVLLRRLAAEGRMVRAVDLRRPSGGDGAVEWLQADVLDREALEEAFAGADVIYHLAALISITGDGRVWSVNVDGAGNAAEAALRAGVRRLVHCSSVHAFDLRAGDGTLDESSPRSTSPRLPVYDRSKAAGEDRVRDAVARGLDAVIVNPTAVIGPFDEEPSRMGRFFQTVFAHRLPASVAGAFDWVDVRDVVSALRAAEEAGSPGSPHLVAGSFRSVAELSRMAADVAGVAPPRIVVPWWFARMWGPVADRMSARSGNPLWYTTEGIAALHHGRPVDDSRARRLLGHDPRPLEETVADIHRWFAAGTAGAGSDQPMRPWANPSVFEQVGQKKT